MSYPTITDEQLIKVLKDPEKLACVVTILAKIDNLEEAMKEHGEDVLVRLACEAIENIEEE